MKKIYKHLFVLLSLVMLSSCYDGIDPITYVDPGPDAGAPIITIMKPTEGFEIQVPEPITSVNIEFKAEDDIELASVTVSIDGSEIASYDSFVDYRTAIKELTYNNIATGDHVLSVSATDISGNTSVSMVNFSKQPPYTPLFNGEIFYMNFDGSFTNLVTVTDATEVGSPGFTSNARVGTNAYAGAENSYLTFPADGMLGEEISISFWYKMDANSPKSGIITMAPYDDTADPNNQNNINWGLRIFRDGAGAKDLRLLVGNGTANRNYGHTIESDEWVYVTATVEATNCRFYLNGELQQELALNNPIDWAATNLLSIMSGAPTFTFVGHYSDLNYMDELRIFNKSLSQEEITLQYAKSSQIFNMSFNGSYTESISKTDATEVGNPGFTAGKNGQSYLGSTDSYLTFPSTELAQGSEFSATFWLKIDPTDGRSGIINIAPATPAGPSDKPSGFGLIREGSATAQKFILLVGNGTNATWVNPGAPATINPTLNEWVHLGITISETKASLYMNGALAGESDLSGFNWNDVGDLVIMSGDPNFNGWNHKTERGQLDDLYLFNKALSQAEVQALMAN